MNILDIGIDIIEIDRIKNSLSKRGDFLKKLFTDKEIELFEAKGVVDKFPLNDGRFSYRIRREEHKHILQCSICHKEVEIPCPMKQFEEIVQNETGFTLVEHNLIMKGVCEDCKKK